MTSLASNADYRFWHAAMHGYDQEYHHHHGSSLNAILIHTHVGETDHDHFVQASELERYGRADHGHILERTV